MNIIVGSAALNRLGYKFRESNDLDIWSDSDADCLSNTKGLDWHKQPSHILKLVDTVEVDNATVATLDSLYTIKCSHLGWDINFDKHKADVLHLKALGAKLIEPLYDALLTHWQSVHGNKEFLSLAQSKKDFFTDNVTYKYDHDYLHEVVAYPNEPMYNSCLKDGEQVAIDKVKFFNMPFENQVQMFREEITVIAIERWLVNPKLKGKFSILQAWQMSLEKTITRLTKNWATTFLILNLEEFIKVDYSHMKNILNKLNEGDFTMNSKELYIELRTEIYETLYVEGTDELYNDTTFRYALALGNFTPAQKVAIGYELLEREGGEGKGDYAYSVFTLFGKTYKVDYYYYSYEGFDVEYIDETLKEVKPVKKTITVWE